MGKTRAPLSLFSTDVLDEPAVAFQVGVLYRLEKPHYGFWKGQEQVSWCGSSRAMAVCDGRRSPFPCRRLSRPQACSLAGRLEMETTTIERYKVNPLMLMTEIKEFMV